MSSAPGLEADRGAYNVPSQHQRGQGYVQYLCADNEWREDTNERGDW
jgi:hypothetical protein